MEKNYTYSEDWFSHNINNWNQIFNYFNLKGKDNLTFLEIGCFEGRSTNYLLDNILTGKNSVIHVIDTFKGSINETGMSWRHEHNFDNLENVFLHNIKNYKDKVFIHKGKSGDILKKDFSGAIFDFIYIDGSHTSYDVLQDAVLCHPLLKDGGLIIFDDFGWKDTNNLHPTNSPELGIISFYNNYQLFYTPVFQGYQVGFIKK